MITEEELVLEYVLWQYGKARIDLELHDKHPDQMDLLTPAYSRELDRELIINKLTFLSDKIKGLIIK